MSIVAGLVIGLVVGLALIVAFVRSENARSKHRCDLAATVTSFARMTVEDSRKLLSPEFYPSWVVFSQRRKDYMGRCILTLAEGSNGRQIQRYLPS